MTDSTPWITAITVCKGRLEHLLQVLPSRQISGLRQIVVDSNCPDETAQRLAQDHPWVDVLRLDDLGRFNVAQCRNAGATEARTDWLAFLDADCDVSANDWAHWRDRIQAGGFYRLGQRGSTLFGSVLMPALHFFAVGGYDEVMEGWGTEDTDLYARLALAGCTDADLGEHATRSIQHTDALRTAFYPQSDRQRSHRHNTLYAQIKLDVMKQFGLRQLPLDSRRSLYEQVRAALAASHDGSAWIDLKLPAVTGMLPDLSLRRTWHYELVRDDR